MTALTKNPMLHRNAWCQCPACNEYFHSLKHFDYHRITTPEGARSCFPGWIMEIMMHRTSAGHWAKNPNPSIAYKQHLIGETK